MVTPAEGRAPFDHLERTSLSRLKGWEAERMSRLSRGEMGDVLEVVDMIAAAGEMGVLLV